ncbi:hypothetical protein GF322_01275 [Candidatus Dependentiae bacterium]|nr:hypothetical protein [Candidatus Dependentiae bacterium]
MKIIKKINIYCLFIFSSIFITIFSMQDVTITTNSSYGSFPDAVLRNIFHYLNNIEDIKNIRLVCYQWEKIGTEKICKLFEDRINQSICYGINDYCLLDIDEVDDILKAIGAFYLIISKRENCLVKKVYGQVNVFGRDQLNFMDAFLQEIKKKLHEDKKFSQSVLKYFVDNQVNTKMLDFFLSNFKCDLNQYVFGEANETIASYANYPMSRVFIRHGGRLTGFVGNNIGFKLVLVCASLAYLILPIGLIYAAENSVGVTQGNEKMFKEIGYSVLGLMVLFDLICYGCIFEVPQRIIERHINRVDNLNSERMSHEDLS